MEYIVVAIFFIGYLIIACEQSLKLDKTVPALIMASLSWGIIAFFHLEVFEIHDGLVSIHKKIIQDSFFMNKIRNQVISNIDNYIITEGILEALGTHLKKISEILVFLIGAMTIVEIIDLHKGFVIIKQFIKTKSKRKLLWIISLFAFVLSAIIDNLTATIVLITILRKIIYNKNERLWYVGAIIMAANSGGAWSPIGDVTTTMLWIAHKVTPMKLIQYVLVPSIICMLISIFILQFNQVFNGTISCKENKNEIKYKNSALMLYVGIGMVLFVPIFKIFTNLPPYLGMMFSLGIVWLVAEIASLGNFKKGLNDLSDLPKEKKNIQKKEFLEELRGLSTHKALSQIEMSSILFFFGILMGVGALESLGFLFNFSNSLNEIFSKKLTILFLGIGSAIIDNVPLVAAALGMFRDSIDGEIWHFIAFSTGTGGSMLIIGSAAGVAAMGMEKISFGWYFKNISWLALLGFFSGSLCFILF